MLILDFNQCISSLWHDQISLRIYQDKKLSHPAFFALSTIESGQSRTLPFQSLRKIKCQCTTFINRDFERKMYLLEEVTDDILVAEKKAYGKVIQMMAHEVNNSIGPINSILQSILTFPAPYSDEDTKDIKEYIRIALDRNQKLNQFTRKFADIIRLPKTQLRPVDLHASIKNAVLLMTPEAEKNSVSISLTLIGEKIIVSLDPNQFEQVLINIIKNSIESIGHQGEIKIHTNHTPASVTISDNGAGISEEQKHHLFTPFYSTKTSGQGIGLTFTREVLHQHQANFSLETKENGWTDFEITFPNRII